MAAPKGNKFAAKGKEWFDALRRQDLSRERLGKVAAKVWDLAEEGEQWAVTEIANRYDGKTVQPVEHSGDDEKPPIRTVTRIIVDQVDME